MSSSVKEVDIDSLKRKFSGCIAKQAFSKTLPAFIYVKDVFEVENEYKVVYLTQEGGGWSPSKYITIPEIPAFEYHHFETGFYTSRDDPNRYILLYRAFNKSFRVGLHNDSYETFGYAEDTDKWHSASPALTRLDLEKRPKPIRDPFKSTGPISNRLFMGKEKLFYMNKVIALVNKETREVLVTDEFLNQEIEDALRGFSCKITN